MSQLPPEPPARKEPPYPWEGPWIAVDPGADDEASALVFVSVDANMRVLVEPVPSLSVKGA